MKWLVIPLGLIGFVVCSTLIRLIYALETGPQVTFTMRYLGILFLALGISGAIILIIKDVATGKIREMLDD